MMQRYFSARNYESIEEMDADIMKYVRELESRLSALQEDKDKTLEIYTSAINEIDDYFEYRFISERDKKLVMGVIDNITEQLKSKGGD